MRCCRCTCESYKVQCFFVLWMVDYWSLNVLSQPCVLLPKYFRSIVRLHSVYWASKRKLGRTKDVCDLSHGSVQRKSSIIGTCPPFELGHVACMNSLYSAQLPSREWMSIHQKRTICCWKLPSHRGTSRMLYKWVHSPRDLFIAEPARQIV